MFKLELSRNIDGDITLLLERQVLCFVIQAEVIDHRFVFIAEIRFVNVGIGGQELLRMTVSDQNWVVSLYWLSLHLESNVGVNSLDHPGVDKAIRCVHADLL